MSCKDFLPFNLNSTPTMFDTKVPGPNGMVSLLPTATGFYNEATPFRPDLAGYLPEVRDYPMGNTTLAAGLGTTVGKYATPGTGRPMRLRCVQCGDTTITTTCIGQLMAFVTTAGQFGVVVTATTATGGPSRPLYGIYPVGTVFKKYDWFYVVEEGPCYFTPANGQTVAAHGPVSSYSTAGQGGPAGAGNAVVGTSDIQVQGAITGTTAALLALMYVKGGLNAEEA